MLYMKEDDMDDLMRKAAENYEIDAEKAADWNAVYAAVHETNESSQPPVEEKKKRRRFIFWWFLLLPLGWIAHTEYNKWNSSLIDSSQQKNISEQNKPGTTTGIKPRADVITTTPGQTILKDKKNFENGPGISSSQNRILFPGQIKKGFNNRKEDFQLNVTDQQNLSSLPTANTILNSTGIKNEINSSDRIEENINAASSVTKDPVTTALVKDSVDEKNTIASNEPGKTAKKKNNKIKEHYFYMGLMAGGDMSFVKYQKARSTGYTAGIIAGYKMNKLSIETGFFIDRKNYYTVGKYFDKSKIPYFDDAQILTVDGYCNMFEIPLNIQYDFSTHKKHTWYAGAGLSSYLMNKEFYNYDFIKYGWREQSKKSYYHTTKDWFSIANINIGYRLQTGNKTSLRIEPYYKFPLSGVGTGNLHITSLGINVGLTRKIP